MQIIKTVFLAVAILSAGALSASAQDWLITPEEAAALQPAGFDMMQTVAAESGPGPDILVKTPGLLEKIAPPIDILVLFEPGQSGLAPDMGSLNVSVVGFFTFDITDRVSKYITGTKLDVKNAELPAGNHLIRLSIKDTKGNANARDMNVSIAREKKKRER